MTFGERLKGLLREKSIPQIEIAAACGVTDSTVNHWVQGRKEPKSRYLPFIARRLGMTIDELFDGVGEE